MLADVEADKEEGGGDGLRLLGNARLPRWGRGPLTIPSNRRRYPVAPYPFTNSMGCPSGTWRIATEFMQ
jgi:hypothetical protein